MKFYVQRQGWGVVIEADDAAAHWLKSFLQTKRIHPGEEAVAFDLYTQLANALLDVDPVTGR